MADLLACPHGMPSRGSCIDCMDEGPVAPPVRWVKVGQPFTAQYLGLCLCEGSFDAGDRIQRWDRGDERTAYLHEGCTP